MSRLPDESLAMMAKAGDRNAEAELVERFMTVARFEAKEVWIPGLDTEDVQMELVMRAVLAIRSWKPNSGSNVKSYVKTCMRRAAVDLARKANTVGRTAQRTAVALESSTDEGVSLANYLESGDTESGTINEIELADTIESVFEIQSRMILAVIEREPSEGLAGVRDALSAYVRHIKKTREIEATDARSVLKLFNGPLRQPMLFDPGQVPSFGPVFEVAKEVVHGFLSLQAHVAEDVGMGVQEHKIREEYDIDRNLFRLLIGVMREAAQKVA